MIGRQCGGPGLVDACIDPDHNENRVRSPHQTLTLPTRGVRHQDDRPSGLGFGFFLTTLTHAIALHLPRTSTMDTKSKLPKERRGVSSMLNVAIEDLNLAKNGSGVAAAKAVFGEVSDLLPTIRVSPLSIRVCRSIFD